jgi:DNA-binding beta-propeller fold protein YncE
MPGILSDKLPPFGCISFQDSTLLDSGPFSTGDYIFAGEWLEDSEGDYLFDQPRGIAIGPDGRVYVTDYGNHSVTVFDRQGMQLDSWGSYGSAEGMFIFPIGIDISEDGFVYVADSGNRRIQKFTTGGSFVAVFADEGSWPGELIQPEGISTGPDRLIMISDSGSGTVAIFKEDGSPVTSWNNELARGVDFDQASNAYIAGCPSLGIRKYDLSGVILDEWIYDDQSQLRFDCLIDLALDSEGNILVVEYGSNRFLKLSGAGETVAVVGQQGTDHGQFDRPGGIAVSDDRWVFIADTFNRRIQIFAPIVP